MFLKVLRLCDLFCLGCNELLSLARGEAPAKELINRMQVDRQAIDLPLNRRLNPANIRHHLGKPVHVTPDLLLICMEDMWPKLMEHNPSLRVPLSMTIPSYMWTLIDHLTGVPRFC